MFFLSLLLSAITFNPAMAAQPMTPLSGSVQGNAISPDALCKGGAICAYNRLPINRNGCHVNNVWNSTVGGTPLTIDVTETGANGSKVWIYWVNATSQTIHITKNASANYYCPK
jgi:hypothetical protein